MFIMKKRKKVLKSILIMIVIILLTICGYNFYKIYEKIEIKEEYIEEKTILSTEEEQNVDKLIQKSETTADMIEKVTKSVCGISKLTNAGSSILTMKAVSELGLGTGVIVSNNGYIISNTHVTGEKFSTCYVKIEGKNTYTGTVVWADTDLDISIVKINTQDLEIANLGNWKSYRI